MNVYYEKLERRCCFNDRVDPRELRLVALEWFGLWPPHITQQLRNLSFINVQIEQCHWLFFGTLEVVWVAARVLSISITSIDDRFVMDSSECIWANSIPFVSTVGGSNTVACVWSLDCLTSWVRGNIRESSFWRTENPLYSRVLRVGGPEWQRK